MLKLVAKVGLALLVVVALGVLWLMATQPKPTLPPKPPIPNGYTNLLASAYLLEGEVPPLGANPAELRGFVATNKAQLAMAHAALSDSCLVPLEYSADYLRRHVIEMGAFKRLAKALAAEGQVAELEGQTNQAWKVYLEIVEVGQVSARGGVVLDKLVGVACENIGLKQLAAVLPALAADQCRAAIQGLQRIDMNEESVAEVLQREKVFLNQAFGWRGRISGLLDGGARAEMEANCARKAADRATERHQLLVKLATRAFVLEKGRPPQSPAELVPAYLPAIPRANTQSTNQR